MTLRRNNEIFPETLKHNFGVFRNNLLVCENIIICHKGWKEGELNSIS